MSGVRSESIHSLRAQQCSASTTEGQHMYSRVSVHASNFTSQQVLLMKKLKHIHAVHYYSAVLTPSSPQDTVPSVILLIFSCWIFHLKLPFIKIACKVTTQQYYVNIRLSVSSGTCNDVLQFLLMPVFLNRGISIFSTTFYYLFFFFKS